MSRVFTSCKSRLLLVFTCIFVIHFLIGIYLAKEHPQIFLQDDSIEYYDLGVNLGTKGEFIMSHLRNYCPKTSSPQPEAYRFQILSLILGCVIFCGVPPAMAAAFILASLAALSSILVFLIARKLVDGNELAGWIACLFFQFHPMLALYSVQFRFEPAFVLSLLLLFHAFLQNGWRRIVMGAIAGALSVYIRPTALVFIPSGFCLILLLDLIRNKWHFSVRMFQKAAVYVVLFFLLILPIGIRNYVHFGQLNFSGYYGGFNLYVGNNRYNMQAYRSASSGREFIRLQNIGWDIAEETAKQFPVDTHPAEVDSVFRRMAWNEIRAMSAGDIFYLFAGKAWHFLRPYPVYGVHDNFSFWILVVVDSCLLFFGVFGMCRFARKNAEYLFVPLMIIGTGLVAHTLVHVYLRHRVPFVIPVLCIYSAAFIAPCVQNIFKSLRHGRKYFLNRLRHQCHLLKWHVCAYPFKNDKRYIGICYWLHFKRFMDWDNPCGFNEKNNWRKLYDRKQIYTDMVDKRKAKDYIASRLGEGHSFKLLYYWKNPDDIDINALPDQFVLKCNHSGGVIICRDKKNFDWEEAKALLKEGLEVDYYMLYREWPYKNVERCVVCEEYMGERLTDYKVYCFNGKPQYVFVWTNKPKEDGSKPMAFFSGAYTMDWVKDETIRIGYLLDDTEYERPGCLEEMLRYAGKIAAGTIFLRVDCYVVDNKPYIGEMTFFPWAGFMKFEDESVNLKLGRLERLP